MKNIVLIGFMGTGKSSVGRVLAKKTRREFVDLDRLIEEKEKRKIRDIFEKDGEAYFRRVEKEIVRFWSGGQDKVITTGGGVVMDPENVSALRENAVLVLLRAKPETIYERIKHSKSRPLLKDKKDLLVEIQKLLLLRGPFYENSDYAFDTDGKNAAHVAHLIEDFLAKKGENS